MDRCADNFPDGGGYVVTVSFHIHAEFVDAFRQALKVNALKTLEAEQGCWIFELSEKPGGVFFLYEVYADKQAFECHLQQPYFIKFEHENKNWVIDKSIDRFQRTILR
ncbi:putative quinol monooxygenase [Pantoea sp. App145]|uniref:putative quinol monooxygenase n=1 Tax=Pantoea sp. App145 TaxID=3071567 RepID=UPI003A802E1B